jgi:hypothetical protein
MELFLLMMQQMSWCTIGDDVVFYLMDRLLVTMAGWPLGLTSDELALSKVERSRCSVVRWIFS